MKLNEEVRPDGGRARQQFPGTLAEGAAVVAARRALGAATARVVP